MPKVQEENFPRGGGSVKEGSVGVKRKQAATEDQDLFQVIINY